MKSKVNKLAAGYGLISIILFCVGCSEIPIKSGIVAQKTYIPDTSSVDMGFTSGGNVSFTPSGSSEQWLLMVRDGDGLRAIQTSSERWATIAEGDTIRFRGKRHID
jgi:hypothetical protein